MSSPLYVFPNLELGDNMVCNGLCRFLAKREDSVKWVSQSGHARDIARMFSDLPNVEVLDGGHYGPAKEKLFPIAERSIRIGYFSEDGFNWRTVQWDQTFYQQAGVDFSERWNSCGLPFDLLPKREEKSGQIVTHEVPERGYVFDEHARPTGNVVKIVARPSFWDWLIPICSAAEFHCVDSSYLNLAESLYVLGFLRDTRLVFHAYSKIRKHNSVPPILRAQWEVL